MNGDGLGELKKEWRGAMAGLFRLIPREARRRSDAALAERTRDAVVSSSAKTIMGFSPLPDEPDLSAFYRDWLAGGGGLALPVWLGGDAMLARRVDDPDVRLRSGRGGVMEPDEGLPEVDPDSLDLVLVPGRAFSEGLDRLGRGGGCYDAFLAGRRAAKIGVAYDFQVFPAIPAGRGDVGMDLVATPSRALGAANAAKWNVSTGSAW